MVEFVDDKVVFKVYYFLPSSGFVKQIVIQVKSTLAAAAVAVVAAAAVAVVAAAAAAAVVGY